MLSLTLKLLLFYAVHSLLAANVVKNWVSASLPVFTRFYRLFYNAISVLLLFIAWQELKVQNELYSFLFKVFSLQILGLILIVISILFMAISFKNYSSSEFLGIEMYKTNTFNSALGSDLKIKGLNQYVRHPLYTASYVFFIGYFLYSPTLPVLVLGIISGTYLYVGALLEEAKLKQQFGKAYADYCQKVRMFI